VGINTRFDRALGRLGLWLIGVIGWLAEWFDRLGRRRPAIRLKAAGRARF